MHEPLGSDSSELRPLVIVFHAAGGSGANAFEQGHWIAKADAEGFVVVGPEGSAELDDRRKSLLGNPQTWNAGVGSGSPAERRGVDDVAFIRNLIDQLVRYERIDPRRVYATGFSNGAAMAFRVGVELSDRVVAIAPVSNALLVPLRSPLAHSVSLLLIWGDSDPLNPIGGGAVRRGGKTEQRPSALESWTAWGQALRCEGAPLTQTLASGVTKQFYARCADGSSAEFIAVRGLGHQWPGGQIYLRGFAGPGSDALQATDHVWDFFRAHSR
jgi:polyhydroxybutyrate depolymerase